jgi:RNA polymerase sigma factor (sigma-70 family)
LPGTDLDAWFVREVLPMEAALMDYLRRNWRNPSDIADLRQEIYVRACEAAAQALPRQTRPFLFCIARNLLIDKVRRAAIVSFDDIADFEGSLVNTGETSPERIVIAREEIRRLRAALDRLPPRCREIVTMRKVEGISQREVASRLGIAQGTVEKQVAKGMRTLADLLFGERGETEAREAGRNSREKDGA